MISREEGGGARRDFGHEEREVELSGLFLDPAVAARAAESAWEPRTIVKGHAEAVRE
jgi:hypothetical protein